MPCSSLAYHLTVPLYTFVEHVNASSAIPDVIDSKGTVRNTGCDAIFPEDKHVWSSTSFWPPRSLRQRNLLGRTSIAKWCTVRTCQNKTKTSELRSTSLKPHSIHSAAFVLCGALEANEMMCCAIWRFESLSNQSFRMLWAVLDSCSIHIKSFVEWSWKYYAFKYWQMSWLQRPSPTPCCRILPSCLVGELALGQDTPNHGLSWTKSSRITF